MAPETVDPRQFRNVLGQYPTGVCVVTATEEDGSKAGFVVGSFTSVSLSPPQVAFFPDKRSSSWPKIANTGRFCVNILGAAQESVCRRFSAKAADKFVGIGSRPSPLGSPIIDGVVAWVDCEIENVTESGDHYIVIGRVHSLAVESGDLPLLFFQGGYGRFMPHSLIAAYTPTGVSVDQLRTVSLVRPSMEKLAADLSCRCVASTVVNSELIVLASAGSPDAQSQATLVGAHLPFTPPSTAGFAAWNTPAVVADWLGASASESERSEHEDQLERVRSRGYSLGLISDAQRQFAAALERIAADPHSMAHEDLRAVMGQLDYDPVEISEENELSIRVIVVPVFDADGNFVHGLTIYGFVKPKNADMIRRYIERATEAAREATAVLKSV